MISSIIYKENLINLIKKELMSNKFILFDKLNNIDSPTIKIDNNDYLILIKGKTNTMPFRSPYCSPSFNEPAFGDKIEWTPSIFKIERIYSIVDKSENLELDENSLLYVSNGIIKEKPLISVKTAEIEINGKYSM